MFTLPWVLDKSFFTFTVLIHCQKQTLQKIEGQNKRAVTLLLLTTQAYFD